MKAEHLVGRTAAVPGGTAPGCRSIVQASALSELQALAGNAAVQRVVRDGIAAPLTVVQRGGLMSRLRGVEVASARRGPTPVGPQHYHRDPDTIREVVTKLSSKPGWARIGGITSSQGSKLHRSGVSTADLPQEGKLAALYEGSSKRIKGKSYRGLRNKQVLRWISTLIYSYLLDMGVNKDEIVEVQAAFADDHVFVSTNFTKTNTSLGNEAANYPSLKAMLSHMLAAVDPVDLVAGRGVRHFTQLGEWLKAPRYALAAALGNPLRVVATSPEGKQEGLHAERRIAHELGVDRLDPRYVGGLRRPCLFCFLHLYTGTDVHPGPMWSSGASTVLEDRALGGSLSADELADLIATNVKATYVTAVDDGPGWTADADTESEDDSGSE